MKPSARLRVRNRDWIHGLPVWVRRRTVMAGLLLTICGLVSLIVGNHSTPLMIKNNEASLLRDNGSGSKAAARSFLSKIEGDLQFCQANNYVAVGKEPIEDQVPSIKTMRNLSLRIEHFVSQENQPECSTVDEFLQAVRYGERRWWNTSTGKAASSWQEVTPSYFAPFNCRIPIASPRQICHVLSQFSHVVLLGDSLQRHVYLALISSIKNDFVRGGMTTLSQSLPEDKASLMMEKCYCDGQFSEHKVCRHGGTEELATFDPRDYCRASLVNHDENDSVAAKTNDPRHQQPTMTNQNLDENNIALAPIRYVDYSKSGGLANVSRILEGIDCSTPNHAPELPILLILQGGLHFQNKARHTFLHLSNLMSHPTLRDCAKHHKLYVIWNGSSSQSPSLDHKYPAQAPAKALQFDEQIVRLLRTQKRTKWRNFITIHWMNFTRRAQTSDGLHFLTEANYFKAQYLIHLGRLMKQERVIFEYNYGDDGGP